jgi:hypothetical protein
MQVQTFNNAFCARCRKPHDVQAKTVSGAIKKATLECNGIIQTSGGPKLTACAGVVLEG